MVIVRVKEIYCSHIIDPWPYPNHDLAMFSDALHRIILFDASQCRPIEKSGFGATSSSSIPNGRYCMKMDVTEDAQTPHTYHCRRLQWKDLECVFNDTELVVANGRIKYYLPKEVMNFDVLEFDNMGVLILSTIHKELYSMMPFVRSKLTKTRIPSNIIMSTIMENTAKDGVIINDNNEGCGGIRKTLYKIINRCKKMPKDIRIWPLGHKVGVAECSKLGHIREECNEERLLLNCSCIPCYICFVY